MAVVGAKRLDARCVPSFGRHVIGASEGRGESLKQARAFGFYGSLGRWTGRLLGADLETFGGTEALFCHAERLALSRD